MYVGNYNLVQELAKIQNLEYGPRVISLFDGVLVCILMDYVGFLVSTKYQHSRHLMEAGMRTILLTTL